MARDAPELRFPAGCDTWACPVCGPVIARRKAAIIEWAQPERFLTLTLAPDTWPATRQKVRRFRYTLARMGYAVEWAWTVEEGKRTGMRHVHLLEHGSYLPQRVLQDRWGARVDVRRIASGGGLAGYALKEAAGRVSRYAMKGTDQDLGRHLDLNGGRGVHLSRRFLHGLRSRDVWRLIHPAGVHEWITVPAGEPLPAHLVLPPMPV